MNRCPSCRNLVPAGWIACRRCGAALSTVRSVGTLAPAGAATAAVVRLPAGHDNLLPRAATDNLLPVDRPHAPLHHHIELAARRAHIVAAGVAVVLLVAAWAVSRVTLPRSAAPTNTHATAEHLLQRVVDDARAVYSKHHTYATITPAALAPRSHRVPIVAATDVARPGEVSIRAQDAQTLILATPSDGGGCVFERDNRVESRVEEVVTHDKACRASNAPATGWS